TGHRIPVFVARTRSAGAGIHALSGADAPGCGDCDLGRRMRHRSRNFVGGIFLPSLRVLEWDGTCDLARHYLASILDAGRVWGTASSTGTRQPGAGARTAGGSHRLSRVAEGAVFW